MTTIQHEKALIRAKYEKKILLCRQTNGMGHDLDLYESDAESVADEEVVLEEELDEVTIER